MEIREPEFLIWKVKQHLEVGREFWVVAVSRTDWTRAVRNWPREFP